MAKSPFHTVDEYIDSFEGEVKKKLLCLRTLVKETVPDVEERLSWGAPTYYLGGYLLQFAANKRHIGFYTTPETIDHFKEELAPYGTNSKNTTQFKLKEELPVDLIRRMIRYRAGENMGGK